MLIFLISLIIVSHLTVPLSSLVSTIDAGAGMGYPRRRITNSFEPIIDSESAIAVDISSKKILFQKNGFEPRPIASITKLMTALVFLDQNPDMEQVVLVTQDDNGTGGPIQILPGESIKLEHLFKCALVGSINNAAYEIALASGVGYDEFIGKMNQKATEIGMKNANFVEPTGLSENNTATAEDVAILLREALYYEQINEVLLLPGYGFISEDGKQHYVKNTNLLLKSYLDIEGGKTGYIDEAGFCLVNLVRHAQCPQGIVVVILGAKSKEDRFQQNKFLAQWVFDNWKWEN